MSDKEEKKKTKSSFISNMILLAICICLGIGTVFFFKGCDSDNLSELQVQKSSAERFQPYHSGKFALALNAVTGSEELGKVEHEQTYVGSVSSEGAQVILNDVQEGREFINTINFNPLTGVGRWECRYPIRGFDQITRGVVKATIQDPRYGIWLIELFDSAGRKTRTGSLIPK